MRIRLALLLIMFLLPGAAFAVSSPRRPVPPRPKEPKDAIGDFAQHTRVGTGQRHRNLTVFPVLVSNVAVPNVDLTVDKAVALGLVEISELKQSDVNRVRISSRAKSPVFAMAGEMLRGGKQDRIVADDLVLPPGVELTIPVFCVEHGRWAGGVGGAGRAGAAGFTTGHSVAGAEIRGAAGRGGGARGGGQSGVWSKVAEQQQHLHAPSSTGALRSVHDSPEVRERTEPYIRALSDLADDNPKASGVVAMVGDQILVADLFSCPAVFRQVWHELLESYAIDALDRAEVVDHHKVHEGLKQPNATPVQEWLNGLGWAKRTPEETPGAGQLYRLDGRDLVGTALVWDGGVVHMELFPSVSVKPMEINSLRFRRERLRDG